ncbi:MAG: GntR family transcriptional regulator [Pseudomonadota bacterium]
MARKSSSATTKHTARQVDWKSLGRIDRSRPLGQQIYEMLRLAIILEVLQPKDPVNEGELSEALEVSRTPLREAYQKLVEDGLIESRAKSGTTVTAIDDTKVREGIIIRRALEREVVGLLAADPPDLRPLDSIIALQSVAVSHGDHIEFFRKDEHFHAELANLAGLPAAWRLAHSVKSHTDRARIMLTGHLPQRINVAFNEHIALVEAIKSGDAELSKALVSKHINSALDAVDAAP